MSQKAIYDYGCEMVGQINSKRKFFNYDEQLFKTLDLLSDIRHPFIQHCIREQKLPIDNSMRIEVIAKVGQNGWKMGWHQDDVSFYKNSRKHCEKYGVDKFTICGKNPPVYTMVLYMNTYGEDFFGGEFCFVDLEFKPMKGIAVFFDSREVHCVKKIVSGTRESCVVKFYKN